ncbi:MAG: hypothetical protein QM809_03400 [Gordonia sp. (in: high G+C Gram-positive bacteria)]|uniref:YncE family protein n=1 Tax=Gordonia sp. (in: high G+C Gram-positive bacteria) TaxID=84139 RepID=UPI0039E2625F
MKPRFSRIRAVALVLVASATLGIVVTAPVAHAHPSSGPAPTVLREAGYDLRGYSVGKGNYRGAIDPQTGDLWLTNVTPMEKPTESSLLRVDPNTMRVKKRFTIQRRADTGGYGTVAAAYEIAVPRSGDTVWTTGSPANQVTVWDKRTGKERKFLSDVPHAHGVVFAEDLRVAMISTKPGALQFFDMDTFERLGEAKFPSAGKHLGAGMAITDDGPSGATVTVASYYRALTQFRITRNGGSVQAKVLWNTRQGTEQHATVLADEKKNRVYVNNINDGLSVYDLRTGRHLKDVATGKGTNSMTLMKGKLFAANYYLGYISVLDEKTLNVTGRISTGLLPNQLLSWKKDTFLVIDKSSTALEGGYVLNRGTDRVWKVSAAG